MAKEEYHTYEPGEESILQLHFCYLQAVCEMHGRKDNQYLPSRQNKLSYQRWESCAKIMLN